MSAVPILVTPMPCVLTPVVPIHAPAMLDLQEMESFAQVNKYAGRSINHHFIQISTNA